MKHLATGVHVFTADTNRVRDVRLRELSSQYTHFSIQKKEGGGWVIYAAKEGGGMRWQGIKNSLPLPDNSMFLQITEEGIYGFVLQGGRLIEEWATSSTMEFQSITQYLFSLKVQAEDGKPDTALYLANFNSEALDLLPVELEITDAMQPKHVQLDEKRILRTAKLQLRTPLEVKRRGSRLRDTAVFVGCICLLAAAGSWYWTEFVRQPEVKKVEKKKVDPYAGLRATLTSSGINVKARLVQFYLNMKELRGLNGWRVKDILLQGNTTLYGLERSWGDWDTLKAQVQNKDYLITTLKGQYQLSQRVRTNVVMAEPVGIKTTDVIRYLNDGVAYYWPKKMQITEKTNVTNDAWNQVSITVSLRDVYPADLDNMASLINGWPVTFDQLRATVDEAGALNGEMTLQIVGIGGNGPA